MLKLQHTNKKLPQTLKIALPCLLSGMVLALPLATGACMSKVDRGGYVDDIDIKGEIISGQTTREQVKALMGSPSSVSSFGDEAWYYISDRMETVAFFKPEVTDQQVIRIAFNDSGVVTDVRHLSQKDALEFESVNRETPTEGHSMGIMEQLIGNVGRFNNPGGGALSRNRPGSGSIPGGI